MKDFCRRINIICGHYGSGKTNLAVNLAVSLKKQGEDVTLVDLDIVNPYFRSADFTDILNANGIHTINPMFAGSNLDTPSLTANIHSVFEQKSGVAVIDVGGDDAGAAALGRYAHMVEEEGDYSFLYVLNRFRYLTQTPEEAVEILHEIEQTSRLKVTGIVNNSNISADTTADTIISSVGYAEEAARLAGVPLAATVYDRRLGGGLEVPRGFPVDIYVKPPWEEKTGLRL